MAVDMFVAQMGHSFHWLQRLSHLTIHVGWILFSHQQKQLYLSNPVDFLFYLQ